MRYALILLFASVPAFGADFVVVDKTSPAAFVVVNKIPAQAVPVPQAKKQHGATAATTVTIPARSAVELVLPGQEHGSSVEATATARIPTNAPLMALPGVTSGGCANGQCPSSRTVSRGFIFRR